MKRVLIVAALMAVVSGGIVFATGQAEEPQTPWQQGYFDTAESVTLRGSFTLAQGFPALQTGEGTYTLGAPRAAWIAQSIEEGTELEVEGYLIEQIQGARGGWTLVPENVEGHVRVVEATLDGKTYVLDGGYGPMGGPGMMGHRGMMHGGYGPRGGYGGYDGYAPRGGMMGGGMMGGGYAPRGGYGPQSGGAPNWNRDGGYGRRW